jgi:hypothetical protein
VWSSENSMHANFAITEFSEVRRIPLPRTPVNGGKSRRDEAP